MIPISTTVVVPCYNGLPFVRQAIDSILSQADANVECLVVDDGSTDGSAESLAGTYGGAVRIVRQANAGVAAARNRGFEEAKGEVILWLDADDVLTPDSLGARRQAFLEDPGLDLLVGVYRKRNFATGACEATPTWASDERPLAARPPCPGDHPHVDVLTFRRAAFAAIGGFDSQLATGEDYDLWIRAWAQLRWKFTDAIQAWHRIGDHPRLTRHYGQIKTYRNVEIVLRKNRQLMRQTLGSDRPWRQNFARWAANYALVCLNHQQRRLAVVWAFEAIRTGRDLTDSRAFRFLVEAMLPRALYSLGATVARHLLPSRWPAQSECSA